MFHRDSEHRSLTGFRNNCNLCCILDQLHALAVLLPRARLLRLAVPLRHHPHLRAHLPQVRLPDHAQAAPRQVPGTSEFGSADSLDPDTDPMF